VLEIVSINSIPFPSRMDRNILSFPYSSAGKTKHLIIQDVGEG